MIKYKKTNRKNWLTWREHREKLMADPEFVKAYRELQPEFEIIEKIIQARINKKITQKKLAMLMKTRQSAISRLESGNANPSLSFLKRFADALNFRLEVRFLPK